MQRNRSRLVTALLLALFASLFGSLTAVLSRSFSFVPSVLLTGSGFLIISMIFTSIHKPLLRRSFVNWVGRGYNHLIHNFTRSVRVSFSINDFINVVKQNLEEGADFSIIWMDSGSGKIHYRSSAAVTSSAETVRSLRSLATDSTGIYYLDRDLEITLNFHDAAVLLFATPSSRLYMFSRYFSVFDPAIFQRAFAEFEGYLERVNTIEEMFSLSAKSREWDLLAETQMSFLPEKLPDLPTLEMDAFFQALVNVSGDYYNVIPLDEQKTLVFLGDVSGKGLSAALIMGIIMNTIQITEDKEDLRRIVLNVDSAIKGMNFKGKYTTLFIAIIDTGCSRLRFINAGMPEPLVISNGKIRELPGTCCPVGIMDMVDMEELELEIRPKDLLFIGSDGVTEAMNGAGDQLGDSASFRDLMTGSGQLPLSDFSSKLVSMVREHTAGEELRDDLTFLTIRLKETAS